MNLDELQQAYRDGVVVVTPDESTPWLILRCSRASFYRAMAAGEVPGVLTLGRTRRLQLGALLRFIGALPDEGCGGRCHE
jgi:hypothetical protein